MGLDLYSVMGTRFPKFENFTVFTVSLIQYSNQPYANNAIVKR